MKKIYLAVAALMAAACAQNVVTVIPEPVSMEMGCGNFKMSENVQVSCEDSSLVTAAEIFSGDMETVLGHGLDVTVGKGGEVVLSVEEGIAPEGYVLDVKRRGISVKGGSPAGVLFKMKERFGDCEWHFSTRGARIRHKLHLEYGDRFAWPDMEAEDGGERVFCYGLSDHFSVLCDGTVVPCCLDNNGTLALGNIFDSSLEDILRSERAQRIAEGFKAHTAAEEICRKCGYARRFK